MQSLTPRQKQLLNTIIELYLQGYNEISSLLIKSLNIFNISSATIRNELSALTQKGYLKKSHYASGRIPTLAALQVYINSILINNTRPLLETINYTGLFEESVINLSTTDILIHTLNYLGITANSTFFILYKNITLFKNIAMLNSQIVDIYAQDELSPMVFSKITNLLENTETAVKTLRELYSSYAIKSVAIIPIETPLPNINPKIFITYSPFKLQNEIGVLGSIGKPDINHIKIIRSLSELASILSSI